MAVSVLYPFGFWLVIFFVSFGLICQLVIVTIADTAMWRELTVVIEEDAL